jgi:hypothetical protein
MELQVMIDVSRPMNRHPGEWTEMYDNPDRQNSGLPPGGAPAVTAPVPASIPGDLPYAGLDPSNPVTWKVRSYNPQPGMIALLNFNGASMAAQGHTDMGGVWSNPADWNALVATRPRRRPR